MPRIDPMKLLVCLSVLLAPNGGIRNAGEVRRLANLMAKFSKKLVSKAIYIQILKCTETELLGQFMQTGGWTLVHTWLVDGIASKNWPLIQELMELLLCCPVDVERLKINSTPRLVKSLSTDSAHESVKVLATKLVEQWLYIVKAPKQLSPMVPINQSELPAVAGGQAGTTEGKHQHTADGTNSVLPIGVAAKQGGDSGNGTGNHYHQNGYALHTTGKGGVDNKQQSEIGRDDVDGGKTTFQTVGGELQQGLPIVAPKKTSLVLKITTKNGKQVVAKVIKPNKKQQRGPHGTGDEDDDQDDDDADDDDEEEDQEEVVVNIESGKSTDETVATNQNDEKDVSGTKKIDVQNGIESSSKERNTSSSKEKDRHHHSHREKEKDRKGSSSSGSRSSSSKSSGSSSNSSSKHKSSSSSSSKSSSSSSSRSKDKDRHSSSSSSSSSKHKTSSSSKSSSSSGSKSNSSSSDKHRDHKDKSSHSTSGSSSSSSSSNARDSKNQSQSFSSPKLSRKNSRDDGAGGSNDSGSESSSTTNTSANGAKTTKSASATTIPNKKASISIEVRNPENRPKTVKTYNSQFRSHGLIEEAPPPPSRKGLKKPTSTSPSTASTNSTSTTIGSTAIGTVKRSSPIPTGRDAILAGSPVEKKPREDPIERPGSIKLIPPKRQHALVESDMFMDALSATLRKDVKKRKRRTSGSEGATTTVASSSTKPGESTGVNKPAGADASTTKVPAPGSPTSTADDSASEATTPTTPTSPKVPTIAPMSFYRDTLAEQEEENGSGSTATEDGTKKEEADTENNGADGKKITADETEVDDDGPILKKPKRVKCELNEEDDEEEKDGETVEKTAKKQPAEGDGNDDEKTELMAVVMSDVEKKIAEEAEGEKKEDSEKEDESPTDGRKPPGPGCGPDGPPGVLVIHRRKGPKKQLRWKTAEELEEVRYFELDVTERCNVTKSFTDMKQMERVDERQKFMLSRKVGSEDIMVERTTWRALVQVDNVPASPDGNQSLERNVQRQRERGCLQALYFNKHMIPDSAIEPDPADIYQTADPVHIPLEDVTGNPDSVNDFTSVPWPDPKSTPPHESGAFNSPFFPSDLPPAAGFGPGDFPPPFAPGAAATIGPGPWNMGPPGGAGPRPGVLPPGMFPLNQPPPGMGPGSGGGGGGSPNMLNMPLNMSPNVPPPGMFPGATNFNAPPPELGLMAGGPDMGGRRGPPGPGGVDFRNGPPPPQQWVTGNRPFVGGNNPSRGGAGAGGFGNRGGGGGGNWNNRNNGNNGNRNGGGDRGRMGDDGRGNYRGHWLQNNRGHNRGGGGRKW